MVLPPRLAHASEPRPTLAPADSACLPAIRTRKHSPATFTLGIFFNSVYTSCTLNGHPHTSCVKKRPLGIHLLRLSAVTTSPRSAERLFSAETVRTSFTTPSKLAGERIRKRAHQLFPVMSHSQTGALAWNAGEKPAPATHGAAQKGHECRVCCGAVRGNVERPSRKASVYRGLCWGGRAAAEREHLPL